MKELWNSPQAFARFILRYRTDFYFFAILFLVFGALSTYTVPAAPSYIPNFITQSMTIYVAPASTVTCTYNGDGGNACTPADTNANPTQKSTPFATLAQAALALRGHVIVPPAVVTVQLANANGTGTACYRPNGAIFDVNVANGYSVDTFEFALGTTDVYPNAYLILQGDTTTPANVVSTGATTCAGTTSTDLFQIKLVNTVARVTGIQFQYTGGQNDDGPLMAYKSQIFIDTCNFTSDGKGSLLTTWDHSITKIGGTLNVTTAAVIDILAGSTCQFHSPAGRANVVISNSGTIQEPGYFISNEFSHMQVDGMSLSITGGASATFAWFAIAGSSITDNDNQTFNTPAQQITYNQANLTIAKAIQGSYIQDNCRTAGQKTCTLTSFTARAVADQYSYVHYVGTPGGTADTATNSGTVSNTNGVIYGVGTKQLLGSTAPTISSGFGSSPSIIAHNSWQAFTVNVGTGGTATSGVIGFTPAASTGWACTCTDITTNSSTVFITKQTASSTTTCTVGNFNTSAVAAAWVASNTLSCSAFPY